MQSVLNLTQLQIFHAQCFKPFNFLFHVYDRFHDFVEWIMVIQSAAQNKIRIKQLTSDHSRLLPHYIPLIAVSTNCQLQLYRTPTVFTDLIDLSTVSFIYRTSNTAIQAILASLVVATMVARRRVASTERPSEIWPRFSAMKGIILCLEIKCRHNI